MKVDLKLNLPIGVFGNGTGQIMAYVSGTCSRNIDDSFSTHVESVKVSFPTSYRFEHCSYGPDLVIDLLPAIDQDALAQLEFKLRDYLIKHEGEEIKKAKLANAVNEIGA